MSTEAGEVHSLLALMFGTDAIALAGISVLAAPRGSGRLCPEAGRRPHPVTVGSILAVYATFAVEPERAQADTRSSRVAIRWASGS